MATRRGETQLTLRVDLDADPITGSLTSSRGASRRFAGWIGLAAALETLRAERPPNPNPPATGPHHGNEPPPAGATDPGSPGPGRSSSPS